jgi:hypothetical protein
MFELVFFNYIEKIIWEENQMKLHSVTEEKFRKYGKVIRDIDFTELVAAMANTPCPDGVVYVPGDAALEALPIRQILSDKLYGELPVQIGYCNGHNSMLNALEYHSSSEINIAASDAVLIVGNLWDVTDDLTYDTARLEAFLLPAGTGVELYATTLHYAPCGANKAGFRVAIVLPEGTNYDLKNKHEGGEDAHLTATNKWLLGHPEGGLPEGSPMGLIGKNLNVDE